MGFVMNVKRSKYYQELTEEKRKEYLSITRDKFLPSIDNIYYTLFIKDDSNENENLQDFFLKLELYKKEVTRTHQPQVYENGLQVDSKSYKIYKYCLSEPDLYDIFISNYLPNNETPRICVQLRAYGLWVHGAEKMLTQSFNAVQAVLKPLNQTISHCRESRIDYCYHTNMISNPERIFGDNYINKHMTTTMKKWGEFGRVSSRDNHVILKKDYFALGDRKSNLVFIRCYNKTLEVVEKGYKGFIFKIWHDFEHKLISFYDKYCLEYAYEQKNYDALNKGKLMFYLEYGTNDEVKHKFETALQNKTMNAEQYRALAESYMPEVTTIMNIEFETKRRFYYYTDNQIENFKTKDRTNLPEPLNRIFKIHDNSNVYLDFLTNKAVSFRRLVGADEKGKSEKEIYEQWWYRLRCAKLEGIETDEKLVREYSKNLDKRIVQRKLVNNVATNAVYGQKVKTEFIEDISDLLSNLNDNDAHDYTIVNDDGEILENLDNNTLLIDYQSKKRSKEQRLKNRINNGKENAVAAHRNDQRETTAGEEPEQINFDDLLNQAFIDEAVEIFKQTM